MGPGIGPLVLTGLPNQRIKSLSFFIRVNVLTASVHNPKYINHFFLSDSHMRYLCMFFKKLWAEQDKSFSTDWDATKILSTLSSFWLPESPPATPKREPGRHFRQLSWSNSIHPSSFRLVAQLSKFFFLSSKVKKETSITYCLNFNVE